MKPLIALLLVTPALVGCLGASDDALDQEVRKGVGGGGVVKRALLVVLVITPVLVGCLGPSNLDDPPGPTTSAANLENLIAPGADHMATLEDGSRVFTFEGTTQGQGASLPLTESTHVGGADLSEPLEVDGRVGYVIADVTFDPVRTTLEARILDADGQVHCLAYIGYNHRVCSAPINASMEKQTWHVEVSTVAPTPTGTGFEVNLTLVPRAVLAHQRGDPLEGVDTNLTFRTSVHYTGFGAEPTLGVLSDGTILVQKWLRTERSTDGGQTWERVTPPTVPPRSEDPYLRVDPWNDRVYVSHLYVACSHVFRTDDAGDTWLHNPHGCGGGGGDHQKLATGPPPNGGLGEPIVYQHYATGQLAGLWTARSLDGGLTWHDVPVVGHTGGREPYVSGPTEADRAGNVYTALYMCDQGGYVGLAVSRDAGLTYDWTTVDEEPWDCWDPFATEPEPSDTQELQVTDAGLAIDTAGTVYLAYERPSGLKYAYSTDQGATWSEPITLNTSALGSHVHTAAVAGDPGRLAVLYRATADSDQAPQVAPGWSAWNMYVAFLEGADTGDPTIRTAVVNAPSEPTQRGPICVLLSCPDRNLRDFVDIDVLPDGRVVAAYADGCAGGPCPTQIESEQALGTVAVLEQGPRLFEDRAPWAAEGAAGEVR